jgi:hypothetical protein
MSRMMTIRPSPKMVAPAMPRIPEICGPKDFTTISRLPTNSSVTSAVECSPARISTTAIETSASGRRVGAKPTNEPSCWKRYFWPPYSNSGASLPRCRATMFLGRRTTPSTVASGNA